MGPTRTAVAKPPESRGRIKQGGETYARKERGCTKNHGRMEGGSWVLDTLLNPPVSVAQKKNKRKGKVLKRTTKRTGGSHRKKRGTQPWLRATIKSLKGKKEKEAKSKNSGQSNRRGKRLDGSPGRKNQNFRARRSREGGNGGRET